MTAIARTPVREIESTSPTAMSREHVMNHSRSGVDFAENTRYTANERPSAITAESSIAVAAAPAGRATPFLTTVEGMSPTSAASSSSTNPGGVGLNRTGSSVALSWIANNADRAIIVASAPTMKRRRRGVVASRHTTMARRT